LGPLPRFSKPTPNRAKSAWGSAKSGKGTAKEKAWISLDSLCGFETFQSVALTPAAKILFPRRSPDCAGRRQESQEEATGPFGMILEIAT
jgi:hypothetical protein